MERETVFTKADDESGFHCFTESPSMIRLLVRRGYLPVGFTGGRVEFDLPRGALTVRSRRLCR